MFRGICVGGFYDGKVIQSEHDSFRVADIPNAVLSIEQQPVFKSRLYTWDYHKELWVYKG